jgi:hypothetical protein
MPWTDSANSLSTNKTVAIDKQDALQISAHQPFLTFKDANAGNMQARIQSADGKLVFYVQSALNAGVPSVIFNSLAAPGAQPLPTAVEIHAQDGVNTIGYQPFLTLTDANAGFVKARVQNANGDLVLYSEGGMNRNVPEMIVESVSGDVHVTGSMKVDKDVVLTGSDCAERFDLAEHEELEAGTVVVIGEDGMLRTSNCAYDKCVAGVVAGAGEYRPAIVMGSVASDRIGALVALIGKTYCKVDASGGAIEVGDLLTILDSRARHESERSGSSLRCGARESSSSIAVRQRPHSDSCCLAVTTRTLAAESAGDVKRKELC